MNATSAPSVQNVGDVYMKTDADTFYISTDGLAWTAYVSMPKGALLFFETSCPSGWTAKSAWDDKFLKGALISSFPLGTGGASTHTHDLDDIVNHTHSTGNRSISMDNSNFHPHNIYSLASASGTGTSVSTYQTSLASISTESGGAHTHSITASGLTSGSSGSASPVSDSESTLPAYKSLILCEKD